MHPAKVAVVQSTSHRLRFAKASSRPFSKNFAVPWIDFEYFGDEDLGRLTERIERGDVHGLVLASECLQSPPIRTMFESPRMIGACHAAYGRGMGICVFKQHSREPIECRFLPSPFEIVLQPTVQTSFDSTRIAIDARFQAGFTGARGDVLGDSLARARSEIRAYDMTMELKAPNAWEPALWRSDDDLPLLVRSRGFGPQIVACALPLDWDARSSETVKSLLARVVRYRGCIYVRPDTATPADAAAQSHLADVIDNGTFVHEHALAAGSSSAIDLDGHPIFYFRDVVLSPGLDLAALPEEQVAKLFGRLEKGGSLTGFTPGPGDDPLLVEIATPPRYVRRVQAYVDWLAPHLPGLDSVTTNIRGVAVALATVERTFRDRDAIPYELVHGSAVRGVRDAVARRVHDDNVDGKFLPTATVAAALVALNDDKSARPLIEWLDSRLTQILGQNPPFEAEGPDETFPALIWLPALRTPGRLQRLIHHASSLEKDGLSRLHAWVGRILLDPTSLDAANARAEVIEYANCAATNPQRRAEALLAMSDPDVWGEEMPVHRLLDAELRLKHEHRDLLLTGGTVESVSLQLAAQLELERRDHLAATRNPDARARPAPIVSQTEALTEQLLALQSDNYDLTRILHFARAGSTLALAMTATTIALATGLAFLLAGFGTSEPVTVIVSAVSAAAAITGVLARVLYRRGALVQVRS